MEQIGLFSTVDAEHGYTHHVVALLRWIQLSPTTARGIVESFFFLLLGRVDGAAGLHIGCTCGSSRSFYGSCCTGGGKRPRRKGLPGCTAVVFLFIVIVVIAIVKLNVRIGLNVVHVNLLEHLGESSHVLLDLALVGIDIGIGATFFSSLPGGRRRRWAGRDVMDGAGVVRGLAGLSFDMIGPTVPMIGRFGLVHQRIELGQHRGTGFGVLNGRRRRRRGRRGAKVRHNARTFLGSAAALGGTDRSACRGGPSGAPLVGPLDQLVELVATATGTTTGTGTNSSPPWGAHRCRHTYRGHH